MLTLPIVVAALTGISLLASLRLVPGPYEAAHSTPARRHGSTSQGVIVGDPPSPPPTVQQLVQQTSHLIRGRVRTVLPARLWFGRNRSEPSDDTPIESRLVVRPVEVEVLEILRDEGKSIGQRRAVVVLEFGGTLEAGGKLYRTAGSVRASMQEGQEVILFLGASEQNSFFIKYGAAGLIVVPANGPVVVPSALSGTSGFAGSPTMGRDALLTLLKAANR